MPLILMSVELKLMWSDCMIYSRIITCGRLPADSPFHEGYVGFCCLQMLMWLLFLIALLSWTSYQKPIQSVSRCRSVSWYRSVDLGNSFSWFVKIGAAAHLGGIRLLPKQNLDSREGVGRICSIRRCLRLQSSANLTVGPGIRQVLIAMLCYRVDTLAFP